MPERRIEAQVSPSVTLVEAGASPPPQMSAGVEQEPQIMRIAVAPQTARVVAGISSAANMSASVELQVATMARRLMTARTIALTGDALGEAAFDGSRDVSIYAAVESLTNCELEEMLR